MPKKIEYLIKNRSDFQKDYEMALLDHEEESRQVAWTVYFEKELRCVKNSDLEKLPWAKDVTYDLTKIPVDDHAQNIIKIDELTG